MISNTHCKNCMFAKPANDKIPCQFEIPSCVKDSKDILVKEDYYYIKNYRCKFAIGDNFYNSQMRQKIEEQNINIKDYIVFQNTIRYYLTINFHDTHYSVEKLCNKIRALQILPKFISVIFYMQDKNYMVDVIDQFKNIIGNSIEYKIHNFIENISKDEALFTVLETTYKKNNTQYLWILNNDSLDYSVDDESIAKINYQINVIQPICNGLKSKISTDNFDTLFLNFENYSGITKNVNQSLSEGIKSIPNMIINDYD